MRLTSGGGPWLTLYSSSGLRRGQPGALRGVGRRVLQLEVPGVTLTPSEATSSSRLLRKGVTLRHHLATLAQVCWVKQSGNAGPVYSFPQCSLVHSFLIHSFPQLAPHSFIHRAPPFMLPRVHSFPAGGHPLPGSRVHVAPRAPRPAPASPRQCAPPGRCGGSQGLPWTLVPLPVG